MTEWFYCYCLMAQLCFYLHIKNTNKKIHGQRLVLTAYLWRRRIKCLRRVINDKEDGDAVDQYLSCYKSKPMLLISKKYSHLKHVKLTAHPCSSPTDCRKRLLCLHPDCWRKWKETRRDAESRLESGPIMVRFSCNLGIYQECQD